MRSRGSRGVKCRGNKRNPVGRKIRKGRGKKTPLLKIVRKFHAGLELPSGPQLRHVNLCWNLGVSATRMHPHADSGFLDVFMTPSPMSSRLASFAGETYTAQDFFSFSKISNNWFSPDPIPASPVCPAAGPEAARPRRPGRRERAGLQRLIRRLTGEQQRFQGADRAAARQPRPAQRPTSSIYGSINYALLTNSAIFAFQDGEFREMLAGRHFPGA